MSAKIFYQWQITPDIGITINMQSQTLVIPKETLAGGKQYKISVDVGMQELQENTVTEEIILNTISSKLVPSISGVQTIGINGILKLSGKNSFDPDGNVGKQLVSYRWAVKNNDGSAVILSTRKPLTFPNSQSIILSLSNILASGRYNFYLTYRVGGRTAVAKHRVKVVDGSPPEVSIESLPGTQNPSNRIVITALIDSTNEGTYEWKCEEVQSTGEYLISYSSLPISTFS